MRKDTKGVLSKSVLATLSLGLLFVPDASEAFNAGEPFFSMNYVPDTVASENYFSRAVSNPSMLTAFSSASVAPVKYFSVSSTGGINESNNGAQKVDAIAIGKDTKGYVRGAVAIGRDAYVATVGTHGATVGNGGIAIGQSAHSRVNVGGRHENVILFNHKDNRNDLVGGIAIGEESHARVGTIDIGNRDYRGQIGDIDFDGKTLTASNTIDAVGATTVGTNSINSGNFSTISGAYNVISRRPEVSGMMGFISNAERGTQGLGSVIAGSLNSIENNFSDGFKASGMASSIVGVANRVNKSNGALVFGAGNEITNSYLELNEDPARKYDTIKELADTFRKISHENRLGSVGIIGGDNVADYAVLSIISGVGNTLKGKANADLNGTLKRGEYKKFDGLTAYNILQGYENDATGVIQANITGIRNVAETAENVTVTGSKNKVTEVKKSVLLGDENEFSKVDDVFVLGNKVKGNVGNSVYLGSGSSVIKDPGNNLKSDGTAGETTTGGAAGRVDSATVGEGARAVTYSGFAGSASTGAVSVGSAGEERRVTNVAAGEIGKTSTDAVNGSQLYAVALASRAEVVSSDKSVTVTKTTEADKHDKFDLAVKKSALTISSDGKTVTPSEQGNAFTTGADVSNVVTKAAASARTEVKDGVNTKVAKEAAGDGHDVYKVNVQGDLTNITSIANGGTKITLNPADVNFGNKKLTGVAPAELSDASTEAVNGSQLKATNDRVGKIEGDIYNVDDSGNKTLKGLKFLGNKKSADYVKTLGEEVAILGDAGNADKSADFSSKNVLTENKADGVHILISDKPEFKELTITGGPKMTASGIDMGNKKISNLAPGTAKTDGVNKSQLDDAVTNINNTINANKIHYFSVKQDPNAGNYNNDGAAANGAIAIGPNARATLEKGLALGYNARSYTREGIVLGIGSGVWNEGGDATGGIAIGRVASSHLMSNAAHEQVIAFNHKNDRSGMIGGIAIGDRTHARIGTIDVGHRDYEGAIGDIEFGKGLMTPLNVIDGVGSTTVGTNSINAGNFATINGAYNVISNRPTKVGGNWLEKFAAYTSNAERATQGLGSTVVGSFNSIENNFPTGYAFSGMASSVIGFANRVNRSNAAVVLGTGNEVTNAYLDSAVAAMSGKDTVKEMADMIRQNTDGRRLGSVAVIGGGNKVDYALLSNVQGVGNTLKGTDGAGLNNTLAKGQAKTFNGLSAYNSLNGYENTATQVNFTSVQGAKNSVENSEHLRVFGTENTLSRVKGSVVAGDRNSFDGVEDLFVLGNEVKGNVGNSVYLGSGSSVVKTQGKNLAKDGAEGATTTGGAIGTVNKATVGEGSSAVTYEGFAGSVAKGAVSVGSAGDERRVMNVAAGEISKTSTDAVNGSQLYAVAEGVNKRVDKVEGDITSLKTDVAGARTEVKSQDGSVTVAKTTAKDGHDLYDLAVKQSGLKVSPDGKTVSADQAGNAFATAGDVAAAVNKVAASARTEVKDGVNTTVAKEVAGDGHDVYKVNVQGDLKNITSMANGDTKLTLGKGTIDVGGAKVSNLAAGVNDTDGVNVRQLKDAMMASGATSRTEVKSGSDNVEVTKSNDPKDLHDVYKITVDEKHNDDLYSGSKGDRKLKGLAFEGNVKSGAYTKTLGDSVRILGNTGKVNAADFSSDNVLTETTKDGLFIKMNDNPEFKAVKADSLTVNGGPVIDGNGIDMQGREIVHAKPGTKPDSVATVSQLEALAGKVTNANADMGREIGQVGAMGAAFSALMPLDYDEEYRTQINVGFGYYHGLQAGALGLTHYVNRDLLLNAAVALSGDNRSYRFGASMRIGSSPKYQTSRVSTTEYAALKKVESLTETVTKLQQMLEEQQREIEALKQQQH